MKGTDGNLVNLFMELTVPSVGVKEGLSCVIFRAIVALKTHNLAFLHSNTRYLHLHRIKSAPPLQPRTAKRFRFTRDESLQRNTNAANNHLRDTAFTLFN